MNFRYCKNKSMSFYFYLIIERLYENPINGYYSAIHINTIQPIIVE